MTNKVYLPCEATQQEPFQVVLIDLQKAAYGEIQCVKTPLTQELKYVAISYRWGELQETSIDTRVGYVASITSFDLQDFYVLCEAITKEPDLQSIPYVWVDAICVNQSDHDQRKETIYHMNEIYERASWILAVPDLHEAHLNSMTNHRRVFKSIKNHQMYIYHLLHGNTEQLVKMDQDFLNAIGVPKDQKLRLLLTEHTHCFTKAFMELLPDYRGKEDVRLVTHLHDLYANKNELSVQMEPKELPCEDPEIGSLHECRETDCPFSYAFLVPFEHRDRNEWHWDILERGKLIRQAMQFLKDLVVDWSSRVWVISEFHISKKKNNLKFWFNQLKPEGAHSFFTFDIHDPRFTRIQNTEFGAHTVYIIFYRKLIDRLNRQTFLEMMLNSKASKNEDRFYSIFPLFPEYKDLVQTNKELVNNISSLVSVKLELFKVMTNEHKLMLLCLSKNSESVLPTFVTSKTYSTDPDTYDRLASKVNSTNTDVTMHYKKTGMYYLRLKPTKYLIARNEFCPDDTTERTLNQLLYPKPLRQMGSLAVVDMLWFFDDWCLNLIGKFDENIWVLGSTVSDNGGEVVEDLPDDFPGFHIY